MNDHPVDQLLDKLEKVRLVAHHRWRARCPAHNGESANVLSIAATDDGTVLVKCFRGCSTAEVVGAVGLELHDLFPPTNWRAHGHNGHPARRPRVDWAAAIQAAEEDLLIVKLILAELERGEVPDSATRELAGAAATRVYQLLQEARNG